MDPDLEALFRRRMSAYVASFVARAETRPTDAADIRDILFAVLRGQTQLIADRRGVQMVFGIPEITQMIYDAIRDIYGPWVVEDEPRPRQPAQGVLPVGPVDPMPYLATTPETETETF